MANEDEQSKPSYQRSVSSGSSKSATVLPWDKFSSWLHCACVVTFDLELGQAMEVVYPSHVRLSEKEKMNICYLSFPDSNSGCMGDTQFHFRIRQSPGKHCYHSSHVRYNEDCPTALQSDSAHLYGFVYFRQTKDKTIRRGYFQKSLVLISRLPFINLFNKINKFIAPEFFDNGEPSLEAACHDIDQWPDPCPGETLNLPMMGSVIQIRIPSRTDKLIGQNVPVKTETPSSSLRIHTILPTLHEVDSFTAFQPVLPHLQMLWEIVLTAEPLVVMATLPTVCANTVQALVGMIWPLKFCTDYRPFFTIHDSEFKEYTTKTQAPPSVILGVTNPFFAKTLQHWPHIIRIGDTVAEPPPKLGLALSNKIKKSSSFSSLKTLDSKPGVYTRYKPFLNKDKTILKRILKGVQTKRPLEVQNAMLRRFLLELTQSFMIPLERYVASLMPLQRSVSPHRGPPELKPFSQDDFLRTLDQSGPQLTSGIKGDWVGLYKKFFKSANFEGWYSWRQKEVNQKLQVVHLEALCNADLMNWIRDKQEVEIVDLILRLREKMSFAKNNQIPVNKELLDKLSCHLDSVTCTLPDDLQSVLRKT